MDSRQIGPNERDLLMHEWSSIISYWATDNSILWQRCSVFLLVNSILFAPVAVARPDSFLADGVLKYGMPIFAISINILWWLVTLRSVATIRHFEQRVRQIRETIPILSFYGVEREAQFSHWYEKVEGKKHVLNLLPALFLVLWLVIFGIYASKSISQQLGVLCR